MAKVGRPRKANPYETNNDGVVIVKKVIAFLQVFMPVTLAKRVVAMILLCAGLPTVRVAELTGICDRSTRNLMNSMQTKEIESLLSIKSGSGKKRKTAGLEEAIVADVEKENYHTRQQIADMIKEKYHIHISLASVGRLLKKNGIKRLKTGSLPAKADPEKQCLFYENELVTLIDQAEKSQLALLFLDASHFVMGCDFLGYIYGKARRFILTFSGRMRYNVLGAIDYTTKRVWTVTNDSYIKATTVCDMLRKISEEYREKNVHIILDNARYQKCKAVTSLAEELHITLHYIPPYSPNLNLIERLWKFVKGELRTKYYNDFDVFRETIDAIIESTSKENKEKISQLIGQKVQLFDGLVSVCPNTFTEAKPVQTVA